MNKDKNRKFFIVAVPLLILAGAISLWKGWLFLAAGTMVSAFVGLYFLIRGRDNL